MTATVPASSPDQRPAGSGLHPLVDALAATIRQSWSALPELAPLAIEPDLEAISGSLDGEKLFIRNELRRCRGLRKLHLETARLGAGLQILHCVFFPDPRYDLPVFGADIVAGPAGVSAAIADLSPTGPELAPGIAADLAALPRHPYSQPRELPAWHQSRDRPGGPAPGAGSPPPRHWRGAADGDPRSCRQHCRQ
ncbi:MAG: hypothetical protein NTW83_11200, partial [Cyanobacteria bacterium]|nr:hypothetical protein [Cyanobacteriota bacterium]